MAGKGAKLRTAAAAERSGIKPVTWRGYVHSGRAPQADGYFDARSPYWYEATVDAFNSGRTGRGWHRDTPDKPRRSPRRRRSFTPEFKAEIVKLCRQGDQSIAAVAQEHDLGPSVVRAWVNQADNDADTSRGGREPQAQPRNRRDRTSRS